MISNYLLNLIYMVNGLLRSIFRSICLCIQIFKCNFSELSDKDDHSDGSENMSGDNAGDNETTNREMFSFT